MSASSTRAGTVATDAVDEILSGYAGLQAAQLAGVLGHSVAVASTGQSRRQEVEQWPGAAYYDIAAAAGNATENTAVQQQALSRIIASRRPEVIIAAAKHRGERSPCLLPDETLDSLPGGTVVIDLNATRGGGVAGSQGLYALGLPVLRRRKSTYIYGHRGRPVS